MGPPRIPLHLGVDAAALALQFSKPHFGIRLRLLHQLFGAGEDAGEPGLGGHEVPAAQALHPAHHVLRRGRQVVAGLVLAGNVVLPEPRFFRGGTVVQILRRLLRELVLTLCVPQAEQDVVQAVDELLAPQVALVRAGEGHHEKRDCERGVQGAKQRPSRVVLTLGVCRVTSSQFTLRAPLTFCGGRVGVMANVRRKGRKTAGSGLFLEAIQVQDRLHYVSPMAMGKQRCSDPL